MEPSASSPITPFIPVVSGESVPAASPAPSNTTVSTVSSSWWSLTSYSAPQWLIHPVQAVGNSYKDANEKYLFELTGSDEFTKFIKKISKHLPNLVELIPCGSLVAGSDNKEVVHEQLCVHVISQLCQHIFPKGAKKTQNEIVTGIVEYLVKLTGRVIEKSRNNQGVSEKNFYSSVAKAEIDELIKFAINLPGVALVASGKIATLFYQLCKIAHAPSPHADSKNPAIKTAENFLIGFLKDTLREFPESESLDKWDPALKPIAKVIASLISEKEMFKPLWAFIERHMPSFSEEIINRLFIRFDAHDLNDLIVKLGDDFSKLYLEAKDPQIVAFTILNRYFAPVLETQLIPDFFRKKVVTILVDTIKAHLEKNRDHILSALEAFKIERDVLAKDPLIDFKCSVEARALSSALGKKYAPKIHDKIPTAKQKFVLDELESQALERIIYHVFGRLALKFKPTNFTDLRSKIIAYAHDKVPELLRYGSLALRPHLGPQHFYPIAEELLQNSLPGLLRLSRAPLHEVATYLFYIYDLIAVDSQFPSRDQLGQHIEKLVHLISDKHFGDGLKEEEVLKKYCDEPFKKLSPTIKAFALYQLKTALSTRYDTLRIHPPQRIQGSLTDRKIAGEIDQVVEAFKKEYGKVEIPALQESLEIIFKKIFKNPGCLLELIHKKDFFAIEDHLFTTFYAKEIDSLPGPVKKYATYKIRQTIAKKIDDNQRNLESLLLQSNYKSLQWVSEDKTLAAKKVVQSLVKHPGTLIDYIRNHDVNSLVDWMYETYFKEGVAKLEPGLKEAAYLESKKALSEALYAKRKDFRAILGNPDPRIEGLVDNIRKSYQMQYSVEVDLLIETVIDKIIFIALKDPIKVIPELILNPKELNNPETLKIAKTALRHYLKGSFENIDYAFLLDLTRRYGAQRALYFTRFSEVLGSYPTKNSLISKVEAEKFTADFLNLISEPNRELALQWLERIKPDEKERGELCRQILLSQEDLKEKLSEINYLFKNVNHDDVFYGSSILVHVCPKLEEYPELVETIADLITPLLAVMVKDVPDKVALYSEKDLVSLQTEELGPLEKPVKEVIDFLQNVPQLREPIGEGLADIGLLMDSNLIHRFFEAMVRHAFKNYAQGDHPDFFINFLKAIADNHFFEYSKKEEFEEMARRLIHQFCPVLMAFPHAVVEKIGEVLQQIQKMVPSQDRKVQVDALTTLLTDKERAKLDDPAFEKRDAYITKIVLASELFSRFIIKQLKALGKTDLPEALRRGVDIDHPFVKHSENVLTATLLKGIVTFLRKVEVKVVLKPGETFKKERLLGLAVLELLNVIKKTFPSYNRNLNEKDFIKGADALWELFELDKEVNIDLSEVKKTILPKLLLKYYMQTFRSIDSIEHNQKLLQEQFHKNSAAMFCNVIGNVWLRDYIPFILSTQKEDFAELIRESTNAFLEGHVLDKDDAALFVHMMDEVVEAGKDKSMPSENSVLATYRFIGKFAEGLMLQFFVDLFAGTNFDRFHERIARNVVGQAAQYYPKVVEIKGEKEAYAHRVPIDKLKEGLKGLFNPLMPLGKAPTDAQLALLRKIKLPRPVPFPDLFSDVLEEKANNKLIPTILFHIFKSMSSPQTINKGLLSMINMINQSLESNWDKQEDLFEEVNNKLDDLNYKLQNEPQIKVIQKLLENIKNEYGADWARVKEILDYVTENIKDPCDVKKLEKIVHELNRYKTNLEEEWRSLNNDKVLLEQLTNLKNAIVNLVPSKLIAPLLKIEHFNELTSLQLGLLFVNMLKDQNVGKWINMGLEILLESMVPNGKIVPDGGHIKFESKDKTELKVEHANVVYTPADEKRDRKAIIDGLATVTVEGTNKALLHKVKNLIRRFKAFMGSLAIRIFGLWVTKLREGFNLVYDFLANKIVGPLIYALGYFPILVIKYFEHLFVRLELNPHYEGFHATYNEGFMFNAVDTLLNMLNTNKNEKDVQNSHPGMQDQPV